MTDEPRKNDEKILEHMGQVKQYMSDDAIFKANFIVSRDKIETRVGKTENRITGIEKDQNVTKWFGRTLVIVGLGYIARLLIKSH